MSIAIHRSLTARQKFVRWGILGGTVSPLLGAVYHRGLPSGLGCPIRHLTGIPCPACGMTRSWIAITQGNLPKALEYHLFGPLLLIALGVLAGGLVAELLTGRAWLNLAGSRLHRSYLLMILAALLVYYALRLYARYGSGDLPFLLEETAFWRAIVAGAKAL